MMNQSPVNTHSGSASGRRRILVVDDHDVGRRSLSRLLEAVGYDVTAVQNGLSAIAKLRDSASPHFVLTDVRLPDVDGREVVQAALALVPRPWIAFITGWDVSSDEIRRLGVDWVFLKPLNISEILLKLQEVAPKMLPLPDRLENLGEETCSSS